MAMYRNTSKSTIVLGHGKSVGPAGTRNASFAGDLVNLSEEDLAAKGVQGLVASGVLVLVGDVTKAQAQAPAAPEAPKVEAPKVEAPKVEAPKVEAPKTETPAAPAPKVEEPKVEAPKASDTASSHHDESSHYKKKHK